MPSESKHGAAVVRYNQKQDQITLRPDKDTGQRIRAAAAAAGQPLQRWIIDKLLAAIRDDDKSI